MSTGVTAETVWVLGEATDEEITAVLAALSRRDVAPPAGYERWRRERLRAIGCGPRHV